MIYELNLLMLLFSFQKCICGATGEPINCSARKYTAYVGENEARIFHIGKHTCEASLNPTAPRNLIQQSLLADPRVTPSTIQNNAILTAIRSRCDVSDVSRIAHEVSCKKKISNEKIKQKKAMYPEGSKFHAVIDLKKYLDSLDELLIYKVDPQKQIVFKTSKTRMEIALKAMDCQSALHDELCNFDGAHMRAKDFVTLIASIYHPFLQEQISLGTMECISEDGVNVAEFWRVFNEAFKKANNVNGKWLQTVV